MTRTLSRERARAFYDRLGPKQDTQGFYEDPALDALIRSGDFGAARGVLEFGCGTGRLAERLLADELQQDAAYLGIDLSPRMVALTRERLAPWGDRARVAEGHALPTPAEADAGGGPFDRIVSTYVLDLLPEGEITAFLEDARALLAPGGRLGLVGLTVGRGPLGGTVTALWRAVHRLRPALVGGCRPLRLAPHLRSAGWHTVHAETVQPWGIASEIVWAEA